MVALTPVSHVRRASWLGRRRVQLLGAFLVAAFLPLAFRLVITPEALWISSFNAF